MKKIILGATCFAVLGLISSCGKQEIKPYGGTKINSVSQDAEAYTQEDVNDIIAASGVFMDKAQDVKVVSGTWDGNMDSPEIGCKASNSICYIEIVGSKNPGLPDGKIILVLHAVKKSTVIPGKITGSSTESYINGDLYRNYPYDKY